MSSSWNKIQFFGFMDKYGNVNVYFLGDALIIINHKNFFYKICNMDDIITFHFIKISHSAYVNLIKLNYIISFILVLVFYYHNIFSNKIFYEFRINAF